MIAYHISQDDIERYYCGRVKGPELATIEGHLPYCHRCLEELANAQQFIHLVVGSAIRSHLRREAGQS